MSIKLPSHNELMKHIMNNTSPRCKNCCYMMFGLAFALSFIPMNNAPSKESKNDTSK